MIETPNDGTTRGEPQELDLPDLATLVGLAGTVHRAEVGGGVCFNTVASIAIIFGG